MPDKVIHGKEGLFLLYYTDTQTPMPPIQTLDNVNDDAAKDIGEKINAAAEVKQETNNALKSVMGNPTKVIEGTGTKLQLLKFQHEVLLGSPDKFVDSVRNDIHDRLLGVLATPGKGHDLSEFINKTVKPRFAPKPAAAPSTPTTPTSAPSAGSFEAFRAAVDPTRSRNRFGLMFEYAAFQLAQLADSVIQDPNSRIGRWLKQYSWAGKISAYSALMKMQLTPVASAAPSAPPETVPPSPPATPAPVDTPSEKMLFDDPALQNKNLLDSSMLNKPLRITPQDTLTLSSTDNEFMILNGKRYAILLDSAFDTQKLYSPLFPFLPGLAEGFKKKGATAKSLFEIAKLMKKEMTLTVKGDDLIGTIKDNSSTPPKTSTIVIKKSAFIEAMKTIRQANQAKPIPVKVPIRVDGKDEIMAPIAFQALL